MDRLLCGDVGFGKTEVALRAAFKCVMGGKQALWPRRPLLASSTTTPFFERMEPLPRQGRRAQPLPHAGAAEARDLAACRGHDRRARRHASAAGQRCALQEPGPGDHRRGAALWREAQGKAQGGLRGVDVLTLSATPIPRTLNMAMSGIRDMSTTTPPTERCRSSARAGVRRRHRERGHPRRWARRAGVLPAQPRQDHR